MNIAPYTLINGSLYKLGHDDILCKCVLNHEKDAIIDKAHSGPNGGHFQTNITIIKKLQAGLWWSMLNKECDTFISKCDKYQRMD